MLTRIDRLSRPALNKGIYVCTRARAGAAANLKAARAGALCSAADGDRNAEQDGVVQLCVARLCGRAWSDYRKSCTAAVPARYGRASEGVAALGRLGSSSVFVYVPTRDICTSDFYASSCLQQPTLTPCFSIEVASHVVCAYTCADTGGSCRLQPDGISRNSQRGVGPAGSESMVLILLSLLLTLLAALMTRIGQQQAGNRYVEYSGRLGRVPPVTSWP
jgi:hypothetical protein